MVVSPPLATAFAAPAPLRIPARSPAGLCWQAPTGATGACRRFAGGACRPSPLSAGAAPPVALALFGQDVLDPAFVAGAYTVSFGTACLLVAFEALLWDDAWRRELEDKPGVRELYASAVRANLLNYLVLAPAGKGTATAWVLAMGHTLPSWVSLPGLLMCQAVGYALAHDFMHRPANYAWTGHKFHHRFDGNTFVRPISANAVTWVEFLIAYVIPLVAGIVVFRPSKPVADAVILAVSFANLCIHTPQRILPMPWAPRWLVTNDKHLFHHEQDVTRYFSAPIFDLDGPLRLTRRARTREGRQDGEPGRHDG